MICFGSEMTVSVLTPNVLSAEPHTFSINQMEPLTRLMWPLTSGSERRNVFLIQGSTVLTSKCNSPQAVIISSAVMAEKCTEGNQINRGMMDWWKDERGECVMSVFTLCPFLTCSSPPGSISPSYHTWMWNRWEQASFGSKSVAHW